MPNSKAKKERQRENRRKWKGIDRQDSFGKKDLTPFNAGRFNNGKQEVYR